MHNWPDTLEEIGIRHDTARTVSDAKATAWRNLLSAWTQVGSEWDNNRQNRIPIENPFSDPIRQTRWAFATAAEAKTKEEVIDLSWIDLHAKDPKHHKEAMRNPRMAPIWREEQEIEMKGLFARGCLR